MDLYNIQIIIAPLIMYRLLGWSPGWRWREIACCAHPFTPVKGLFVGLKLRQVDLHYTYLLLNPIMLQMTVPELAENIRTKMRERERERLHVLVFCCCCCCFRGVCVWIRSGIQCRCCVRLCCCSRISGWVESALHRVLMFTIRQSLVNV